LAKSRPGTGNVTPIRRPGQPSLQDIARDIARDIAGAGQDLSRDEMVSRVRAVLRDRFPTTKADTIRKTANRAV
jgi:hypothetical protein